MAHLNYSSFWIYDVQSVTIISCRLHSFVTWIFCNSFQMYIWHRYACFRQIFGFEMWWATSLLTILLFRVKLQVNKVFIIHSTDCVHKFRFLKSYWILILLKISYRWTVVEGLNFELYRVKSWSFTCQSWIPVFGSHVILETPLFAKGLVLDGIPWCGLRQYRLRELMMVMAFITLGLSRARLKNGCREWATDNTVVVRVYELGSFSLVDGVAYWQSWKINCFTLIAGKWGISFIFSIFFLQILVLILLFYFPFNPVLVIERNFHLATWPKGLSYILNSGQ